jgi:Gas vesicle synthesis protein GvpL/GvpF/Gas vesicle protein
MAQGSLAPAESPALSPGPLSGPQPANLGDILERVLDKGIVIAGDIRVNLLDIELLTIKLRLVITSLDTASQVGINWWQADPWLSTAIVADVGDREYGQAALRRNLEDLDWLAGTARAHHAVLEAVAERGPVVPMRLATLFASDAGVTGTLAERADDFRKALSLISGRSEWGSRRMPSNQPIRPGTPGARPPDLGLRTCSGAALS